MATFTTRFGLRKPAGTDLVTVTSDINASMDKLDAAIDTSCTSSTRPSTSFVGQRIWETDTNRFLVCTSIGPSVWRYVANAGTVASAAARNALTAFEGLPVFRSDKNWVEEYIATAWRIRSVPLVATLADITDPATGQIIIYTPDLTVRRYDGTTWRVLNVFGGSDNAASSASGVWSCGAIAAGYFVVTTNTVVPFATAVRRCPTYVTPDGSFRMFTLNKSGDYTISASLRPSTQNPHEFNLVSGSFTDGGSLPGGNTVLKQTSGPGSVSVTVSRFFPAGTQVCAVVYNRGAGNSTVSAFSHATSLEIKYHGGEV